MLRPLLISLFALACSVSPHASHSEQPIVGGRACAVGENPAAVSLIAAVQASDGNASGRILVPICGGVLIAPDVVLTAAHCLDERDLREDVEALGVTIESLGFGISRQANLKATPYLLPSTPADWINARGWQVHPEFDYPSFEALDRVDSLANYFDLGLVFLSRAVRDTAPARLLAPNEARPTTGEAVSVIGWGIRKDDVTLDGVSDRGIVQCASLELAEIGDHELRLLGEANKCQGDSGSPSFWGAGDDARVIGISSHLVDRAQECAGGSVDARPESYADWLVDAMVRACQDGKRLECDSPEPKGFERPDGGVVNPAQDAALTPDGDIVEPKSDAEGCRLAKSPSWGWALVALALVLRRKGS